MRRSVSWADEFDSPLTDVVEIKAYKMDQYPEVWLREEEVQATHYQELAEEKAKRGHSTFQGRDDGADFDTYIFMKYFQ